MHHSTDSHIALVTGASRGLGSAIAKALAAQGHRVAVNFYRNEEAAKKICAEIRDDGGVAESFFADVRKEDEVLALVRNIEQTFGSIDILVPNATGPQPFLAIEEQTWVAYLDQLEFFVKSPLLLLQAVLPQMKKHNYGRVIQIGSEVFELGVARFANYVAAKGAQLGQTRSWAMELAPYGITVNLVAPGWIPTERHADTPEEDLEAYRSRVPLGRMGVPHDIGRMVAFLASDEAAFITGQKFAVNGGNTLL